MNKTRDELLEPNPYNNHGIHWEAFHQFVADHHDNFDDRGHCIILKIKRRISGTETTWIYRKATCPECGIETAWATCIKHSQKRCRKCELALQRKWNSRASRNYRIRTGQVIHRSTAKCEQCGKEFTPKRSTAKFCSSFCRGMHFRNQKASKDERD